MLRYPPECDLAFGSGRMTEASQLQELLKRARPTWNAKDVEAVQSKLPRVGVQNIPELLSELKANSLNEVSTLLRGEALLPIYPHGLKKVC